MSAECAQKNKLTPSDFLVGVMYYIQLAYPVRTFPPSDDPAWELFVHYLANEQGLGISIPPNFNIKLLLDDVTMLEPETNRIYIDPRDGQGKFPGTLFRGVAQHIYEIALRTKGFIEFS